MHVCAGGDRDGWGCLNGHGTPEDTSDGCSGAWIDVAAFIPMGGLYIVSQILLIHFASASYMFLATAFLLPLQNVVLSWRLVMGAHTGTVTAATFVVSENGLFLSDSLPRATWRLSACSVLPSHSFNAAPIWW